MKKLNEPTLSVEDIIEKCTSNYSDKSLVLRVRSVKAIIKDEEENYRAVANSSSFYSLLPLSSINGIVTKDEMKKLYNDKFVRQDQPGRIYYNELINSAPLNICPYCLQRTVSTLDHFLPKAKYPVYAVSPINLVPSCSDCNKGKMVEVSSRKNEETLHPYFDDVSYGKWIYAKVLQTTPISFEYYVSPPESWSNDLKTKVNNHFHNFNLSELYVTHASVEYNNLKGALEYVYSIGGANMVKNHLEVQAIGAEKANVNSWQAALYRALTDDEWFHNNGVKG